MFVLQSRKEAFHQALFGLAIFNPRNLQWVNTLRAAGLRCALCDDIHYLEWVIQCPDSLSRFPSQSWSRGSQSRNRAGEMLEPGWGPTVAAACPLATGLNGLIMKQRWLLSWRRGRLRQGNTSLMVLSKEKFIFVFVLKRCLVLLLNVYNMPRWCTSNVNSSSMLQTAWNSIKNLIQ